jgi:hypothetical protein
MITDTAPLRYPHYHKADDTPEKLRYDFLDGVVEGLEATVGDLVALNKPGRDSATATLP